jgi:hypothetical protein
MRDASNIWMDLICAFPVLGRWAAWKIGKGDHVRLGGDLRIRATENCILSLYLRAQLRSRGLTKIANVK